MIYDSRTEGLNRPLEYKIWVDGNTTKYQTFVDDKVVGFFYTRKEIGTVTIESYLPGIEYVRNDSFYKIHLISGVVQISDNSEKIYRQISESFKEVRRKWPNVVGALKDPCKEPTVDTTIDTTTKTNEGENTMFDNAKKLIEDNKEIAIAEAERKVGLTAFEKLEDVISQKFPGADGFLKSPLGAIALANGVRAIGSFYTGPKKELVDGTTRILMKGAYAKCGDSVDLNGFIEGLFESVKSVIPGTQAGDKE